jgi:hypothetical protein
MCQAERWIFLPPTKTGRGSMSSTLTVHVSSWPPVRITNRASYPLLAAPHHTAQRSSHQIPSPSRGGGRFARHGGGAVPGRGTGRRQERRRGNPPAPLTPYSRLSSQLWIPDLLSSHSSTDLRLCADHPQGLLPHQECGAQGPGLFFLPSSYSPLTHLFDGELLFALIGLGSGHIIMVLPILVAVAGRFGHRD